MSYEERLENAVHRMLIHATSASGDVPVSDREFPFDPEIVRESIVGLIRYADLRYTMTDGSLVLKTPGGTIIVVSRMPNEALVQVLGHHNGSEDYDGEDSGTYVFWMNRTSLAGFHDRVKSLPIGTAETFLNVYNRSHPNNVE